MLKNLYEIVRLLTSQSECMACRLCEENVGLVYAFRLELDQIRTHKPPLSVTSTGVTYLKRTQDGWCPCFDPTTNKCRIYHDRPLCCRIYPLDLMRLNGDVWWVLHSECPIFQRYEREKRLDILALMTAELESNLSESQIKEWINEDRMSQLIEAFSREKYKVIKLRKFGAETPFHKRRGDDCSRLSSQQLDPSNQSGKGGQT